MKKEHVQIPPPVVKVENGYIKITTLEGQYGFRVCMYRNDDPVTRIFEFVPACPTGGCSTTEISKMEWDEARIDGQEYKIVVFAFDESGKLFSKPTTVTWTAPGPKISVPPPPKGVSVLVPNPHAETAPKPPTPPAPLSPPTPPPDDTPAKDDGSKSPSNPPADKEAANKLRKIIAGQRRALEQHDRDGRLPAWMDEARLKQMASETKEVFDQHRGDKTIEVLSELILTNGKSIREVLAKASKAASAKQKPEPKPADSPAQGQEDQGDHIPIESRVEKLEKRADQTDKDLHAVGSLAAKGINELTQAIAGLRPATPPASGGTPPPQQPIIQHFHYPNSKDNAGTGGDGDDSSGGGKASADKNPPKSADRSWIMLLLGILATLLLLLGFGGWIISSLLGGWILGSKGPSAGFMPAMVPPVIMITNAVAPVTPPLQAVGLIETPAKVIPRPNTVNLDKEGAKEADRRAVGGGNIINSYNTTTYNTVVTNVAVIPAPPVVDSPQPMVSNAVAWASTGEMPYYSSTPMTGPSALVDLSGNWPGFYYPVGTQFLYGYQNPHGHLRP